MYNEIFFEKSKLFFPRQGNTQYIHEHSYEIGAPKKMCTYPKKPKKTDTIKKPKNVKTLSLKGALATILTKKIMF